MFCTKCGKEISDDSLYCKYCGEKQDIQDLNLTIILNKNAFFKKEFTVSDNISEFQLVQIILYLCQGYDENIVRIVVKNARTEQIIGNYGTDKKLTQIDLKSGDLLIIYPEIIRRDYSFRDVRCLYGCPMSEKTIESIVEEIERV